MGYPVLSSPEFELEEEQSAAPSSGGLYLCSKPVIFGRGVPEEGVLSGLFSNVRDALFPRKLPPLHLTSQPVAVSDPMAVKRDPTSSTISFFLHATVIAAVLWAAMNVHTQVVTATKPQVITPITFRPYIPPTLPAPRAMGGGGGM